MLTFLPYINCPYVFNFIFNLSLRWSHMAPKLMSTGGSAGNSIYYPQYANVNNNNFGLRQLQVVTICISEKTKESIQNQIQGTTCIR
jgi:hypothetical protein